MRVVLSRYCPLSAIKMAYLGMPLFVFRSEYFGVRKALLNRALSKPSDTVEPPYYRQLLCGFYFSATISYNYFLQLQTGDTEVVRAHAAIAFFLHRFQQQTQGLPRIARIDHAVIQGTAGCDKGVGL